MKKDQTIISVENGKYTFGIADDGFSVEILRHGEPWLVVEQGCKAIHSLFSELAELREWKATWWPQLQGWLDAYTPIEGGASSLASLRTLERHLAQASSALAEAIRSQKPCDNDPDPSGKTDPASVIEDATLKYLRGGMLWTELQETIRSELHAYRYAGTLPGPNDKINITARTIISSEPLGGGGGGGGVIVIQPLKPKP